MARAVRFVVRGLAKMAKKNVRFSQAEEDIINDNANASQDLKEYLRAKFPYERKDVGHSGYPAPGANEYTGRGAGGGRKNAVSDPRTKGMKSGGKVRGAGCATKGKGKGTMR